MDIKDIDFDHVNDNVPRYGENFDYGGEDSVWCVYVHINNESFNSYGEKKAYIGISRNLKRRWARNGKEYKECDAINNAFKSYGWDNFQHDVLVTGLTQSMADIVEKELIKKFKTNAQTKDGYNIADGGYCQVTHNLNSIRVPIHQYDLNGIYVQSFDSLSEAAITCGGTQRSNTSLLSDCLKRKQHYALGFLWSKEYLDQLDPYNPKIQQTNYPGIIRVSFENFEIQKFSSIYKVSDNNDYRTEVIKVCKHIRNAKSYHNYFWFFETEFSEELLNQYIEEYKKKFALFGKEIIQYDLDGNFVKSYKTKEDIKNDGYSFDSISKVCKGVHKIYKKSQWGYSTDPSPGKVPKRKPKPQNSNKVGDRYEKEENKNF